MKVQFVKDYDGDRYTSGTEYLEGDVITLGDINGKALIELGVCVEVVEEKPKPAVEIKAEKAVKK